MLKETQLTLELLEIEERIAALYIEKKRKQEELKATHMATLEKTREGKTIDELEG